MVGTLVLTPTKAPPRKCTRRKKGAQSCLNVRKGGAKKYFDTAKDSFHSAAIQLVDSITQHVARTESPGWAIFNRRAKNKISFYFFPLSKSSSRRWLRGIRIDARSSTRRLWCFGLRLSDSCYHLSSHNVVSSPIDSSYKRATRLDVCGKMKAIGRLHEGRSAQHNY